MAKEWQYIPGDEWGICDSCGSKVRRSQLKLRWDNLMVCPADFELRHPQDFVKARTDKIVIPLPRPRPPDVFIEPSVVSRTAIAGKAVATWAIAGWDLFNGH
jgi:hypothetical protein